MPTTMVFESDWAKTVPNENRRIRIVASPASFLLIRTLLGLDVAGQRMCLLASFPTPIGLQAINFAFPPTRSFPKKCNGLFASSKRPLQKRFSRAAPAASPGGPPAQAPL